MLPLEGIRDDFPQGMQGAAVLGDKRLRTITSEKEVGPSEDVGGGRSDHGFITLGSEHLLLLDQRLARMEAALAELRDLLVGQRSTKDFYTTKEVAEILSRKEYTVREWCRQGRIRARKKFCGRGKGGEWLVSHEELSRLRNERLLPCPSIWVLLMVAVLRVSLRAYPAEGEGAMSAGNGSAKLTVKQAAEQARVSPNLIYQLCLERRLPHYRIGSRGRRGKILIESSDLAAFFASCKITPESEQESDDEWP
jgi:excisionase family DNA binding protein